jgi:hypothetical protein
MKPTRSVAWQGLALVACVTGCAAPVAPEPEGLAEPRFELSAYDARGRRMPLGALVRRPEFVLSSLRSLEPVELILLAGEPDADLLEDLTALPLRAAHDGRVISSVVSQGRSILRLAPRIALAPDAAYTLALPGSARVQNGAALGDRGPAFVAPLRTLSSTTAGAAWVASVPAAGSTGVPPNLAAAYVALDGEVDGIEAGVWLEAPGGAAVPAVAKIVDCAELETRAVTCVRLDLVGTLEPNASYGLRSGHALHDLLGGPVEPLQAAFETGGAGDLQPPAFEPLPCLPDEQAVTFGCLLPGDAWVEVRVRADESVRVAVRSWERQERSGGRQVEVRSAQLAAAGDVRLRLAGLALDAPFELALVAVDLAGNSTEAQIESATVAALATLSITEVLADPEGPDQAQEYVEVANFGAEPVQLLGIRLADASDVPTVIASDVELSPGARALLVADELDPNSGAIPPGTRLVRVGSSLTKGGLANAGEPLFLRDSEQQRLSAAPMRSAVSGRCLQRLGTADPRGGAPQDFEEGPCTPGR